MASRIPDAWLDELRSRVDIVDLVSDYVELKQKGRRLWGRCPFHGEKTPSFSVDSESQMYYCFGCHKGGTAINFVMEMERVEFLDAVKLMADKAHMTLPERTEASGDAESKSMKERIYAANTEAARFYHGMIWKAEGAQALEYLHRRGLDDAGIRRFGLGATGQGWDVLTRYLTDKGFTMEELKAAGLSGEKDGKRYDMFRNRALFPIINPQGKVLGFGGRILGNGNPKYLNTSDTPVFNKRQGLYALNMVKKERGLKRLILVEGYMDVVSLRQQGIPGVVATLGTALTEEQARLAKRYAPEVWVCYDGDGAGRKAILRALDIFESQEVPARVIDIPGGMDPDDYVKEHGAEGFLALRPLSPSEYRMLRAADEVDLTTQDGRTQYAIACCNILRKVTNPVELENYLVKLAVQTGFDREVLLRQIGTSAAATKPVQTVRENRGRLNVKRTEDPEHVKAEQMLLRLMASGLLGDELPAANVFVTPLYKQLAQGLFEGEKPNALLENLSKEEQSEGARVLLGEHSMERDQVPKAVSECLSKIRLYKLDSEIERIRTELKSENEPGRRSALMKHLVELTNERGLTTRRV